MKTSESEKKEIIDRIVKGEVFSKSEMLRKLLLYLFDSHKQNLHVKAINIAIDLFQREGDLKENDETIARVYIHKLRTKLTNYYQKEGQNEKIIVEIPKGKYDLYFRIPQTKINTKTNIRPFKIVLLILVPILLFNILICWHFGVFNTQKTVSSIWKEYITEKTDVNLMLANPFFYTVRNLKNDSTFVVRNFHINSAGELANMPGLFPKNEYDIKESDISYYANNNINSLPSLFKALAESDNKVQLKSGANINLENILNNNTIALTSLKSIGIFHEFLDQTSIRIPQKNGLSLLLINKSDTIKYTALKSYTDFYTDYAFFIKLSTPKGKILSIISDSHSIGNKGLMELVTNKNADKIILQQYPEYKGNFPKHFELLVKVSGYHEQNLNTEIIHFQNLN
ncbi:hypothetical protein BZG02_15980 [Labilibaculum filiforme]|uniref:Uncharacterized protein n=1 Tax=Labilibaculum filiforme TaxID=1940526 RepID=A0A2N3HTU4_9BACT|nr:hypothetical protein [Labilibaculum filiforme]PKQ61451.1 hypothetical protein BZG02_15980 [Labilibaculum filiforme]